MENHQEVINAGANGADLKIVQDTGEKLDVSVSFKL
jgi:hypothetical protein